MIHGLYYGFKETSVLLDVQLLSDQQTVQINFEIPYLLSRLHMSFKVQWA